MAGEPRDIDAHEARAKGVRTHHCEMPSGEHRFRLQHDDGTAYSRTEAPDHGGWQRSHSHRSVRETHIIQRGRIALAELIDDELRLRVFGPNEICTSEPNIPHNLYLFGSTVLHTVKHGDGAGGADWHSSPVLDAKTRHLNEQDIARLSTPAIAT